MIKIRIISLLFIVLNITPLCAQNTLWLTNGKRIKIGDYKLDNKEVVVYKNLKGKFKSIEKFDVFSIINDSKNEVIIYQQDSTYDEAFTLLEMRAFVQGQYDANQRFKSPFTTVGGVVVAGAASVVINPVYVIVLSGVYCSTIGLTNANKKKIIIPQEYTNNDQYLLGYKRSVKHKRIKNAIIGSVIGLAAGFTTFAIVNNQ